MDRSTHRLGRIESAATHMSPPKHEANRRIRRKCEGQNTTFFNGSAGGFSGGAVPAVIRFPDPAKAKGRQDRRPLVNCSENRDRQLPVALSTETETPGPIVELSETFFM